MPMWGYGGSGPWSGFGGFSPFFWLIVMVVVMIACFRMMGRHTGPSSAEIEDLRREIRELRDKIRQLRTRT